jgi:two-component system chemotaxis sensor kinase CheA
MDMNQYLDIFVEESREHLQSLNTCLLELEREPGEKGMLAEIFRVAHTLKGMSGTMGFSRMQKLTHVMEDVLDALRNDRLKANDSIVDVLFRCLDALENYTNEIVASGNEGSEDNAELVTALSDILAGKADGAGGGAGAKAPAAPARVAGTPVETSAQPPVADSDDAGLLALNQYDVNVLGKALQSGMNVLQIRVELDKGCLLKAARAFIVFQILERSAEVLKANPRVEDIEDERFEYHFTVLVVSTESPAYFEKEINSVAEVSRVVVTPLTATDLRVTEGGADEPSAPVRQVEKTGDDRVGKASESAETGKPQAAASDASKGKSAKTGKTVRVDIDRLDVLMNLVSELIIVKTRLDDVKGNDVMGESVEYLERITTSLHDAVMKVRMVPVETVFNRFPRMIRDVRAIWTRMWSCTCPVGNRARSHRDR